MGILPGLAEKRLKFSSYVENGDQEENSVLLSRNRVDAVISDQRIFEFYNARVEDLKDTADIAFDPIFPPSPYRMMFIYAALRNIFDTSSQNAAKPVARCR